MNEKNIHAERVEMLRKRINELGLDCYIILTDDFHASEYVGDYFKEREFISGFTGSAGTLVITPDFAGLWTDGRYFLQAGDQLQGSGIQLIKEGEPDVPTIPEYLKSLGKYELTIGCDGRTVSLSFEKAVKAKLSEAAFKGDLDLPGEIWSDRPAFPENPIWLLEEKYTGMSTADKLRWLRTEIADGDADGIVLTALDEIAWLFNMRGNDVHCLPVAMAYAVVTGEKAVLYIAPNAVSDPVINEYFQKEKVELKPYFAVYNDLPAFDGKLMADTATLNISLAHSIKNPLYRTSPVVLKKAVKTQNEIENTRVAHLKDGIAMTKAIYRMKKMAETGEVYKETEISLEKMITGLREEQEGYIELSFDSIVATGAHGAIVHYEATPETDAVIEEGFLLIDTGAHYMEGTTDITRTVSIGKVSDEMKKHYTAVLQGHLNIAGVIYPRGTRGVNLDAMARQELWKMGLDYNHGTGHGVGYILNVHEDPNSIRKGTPGNMGAVFEPGMITSNEPGLYLEGKYGIRIENLVLTVPAEPGLECRADNADAAGANASDSRWLAFESLTLAPYDRASIKPEMLTADQIRTLNAYNHRVYTTLAPHLTPAEAEWLRAETAEM